MSDAVDKSTSESHWLQNLVILLLVVFLVLLGLTFYRVTLHDNYDKQYLELAGEQRVLSQRIAKSASEAVVGRTEALSILKDGVDRFQETVDIFNKGNPVTKLPPAPPVLRPVIDNVNTRWVSMQEGANEILSRSKELISLGELAEGINAVLPELLGLSDDLVAQLVELNADPQIINIAARQRMLTQRIAGNVARALQGGEDAIIAADRFGRDVGLFGRVLNAMRSGDDLMEIQPLADSDSIEMLDQIDEVYAVLNELISDMLEKSIELFQVQEGASQVFEVSEFLVDDTNELVKAIRNLEDHRLFTAKRGLIVGAITVTLLILLGIILLRNARKRRIQSERLREESETARSESDEQNQRNQEAILRLLDEISDLADGDLSVKATVTEDFTGAIADSINYAIDAMRDLVTAINSTTQHVSSAAQETQATAMHLAEASDHQAQEISNAGASINEMAVTMERSAEEAGKATLVAQKAVETAKRGGEAVGNTIQAMDGIREQIQETSKRIKRLGESSQEIGEIVGLINDIADQTNILALNAAIQAAMAGEAGRGFAVVADEVQRLAERVGNATKQIDALVRTIQTDTNEAVMSMEESTGGVVRGARLAEAAGQALEEVETESDGIAKLINELSQTSQQQAQSAERISETVNVIQEITTQTSAGTNETATSIGQLAKLANELGKSVAGFKLPS